MMEEQRARWAVQFYYKHRQEFITDNSLDNKKFAHHFHDSTFIPLISPQSIGDEEKKKVAVDASSSMRPEYMKTLDGNLWAAWEETAEAVKLSDANMYDSFNVFLEEEYFNIVRKTCDEGVVAGAEKSYVVVDREVTFQPMVDPEFEVTSEEAEARKDLLQRTSAIDHACAVLDVAKQYSAYLDSRTPIQRKILPSKAPQRFAASKYYGFCTNETLSAVVTQWARVFPSNLC